MKELVLRAFCMNFWGIGYTPIFGSKDNKKRLHGVVDELLRQFNAETSLQSSSGDAQSSNGYDFLFFQELWLESDRLFIKEALKDHLPYSQEFHGGVFGTGTMIFSRHPILEIDHMKYGINGFKYQILYGDAYCGKGVGMVQVQLPQNLIANLYVSHFTAEYTKKHNDFLVDRTLQAFQALDFIHQTTAFHPADFSIFAGDFNSNPKEIPFKVLNHFGGLKNSLIQPGKLATFNRDGNTYKCGKQVALDHILLRSETVATEVLKFYHPFPLKIQGEGVSFSDHEAIALDFKVCDKTGDTSKEDPEDELLEQVDLLEKSIVIMRSESEMCSHRQKISSLLSFALLALFLQLGQSLPAFLSFAMGALTIVIVLSGVVIFRERKSALNQQVEKAQLKLNRLKVKVDK